ncbi:MAG: sulfotransferase domain-containing protein, partial [Thermoanaerobaculia bacterium]|nr:sulfotransferase domain-containing protein [Thermoanaerobaculia bacterium]
MEPIKIMIAGAQKAGTSSLLQYLGQHPDICIHRQLEFVFFFSDFQYPKGYEYSFREYFPHAAPGQILLAKHAMLMYSETAIERLYDHNSNASLIALLRNPIDRAYSAYWFARSRGWEDIPTFEEAIRAEPRRIREDGWLKWRNNAYLENGKYAFHLERIQKYFGAEKTRVYLIEDLKTDPGRIFRQVFEMAGVSQDFAPDISNKHNPSTLARSEKFAQWFAFFLNPRNKVKGMVKQILPSHLRRDMREYVKRANTSELVPPPMAAE